MMHTRRDLLTTLLALPVAACAPAARAYHRSWHTFGTLVRVTLEAPSAGSAQAAFSELTDAFNTMNRDWYAWGDGELGTLNQALATRPHAAVSTSLAALLADAVALGARSGDRFNVCTGNLSQAWGFHTLQQRPTPPLPDSATVAAAQQHTTCQLTVDTKNAQVSVANRNVVIDLGGIAKGAVLRDAVAILADTEVTRALIDVGGDLIAYSNTTAQPYTIGLRDPRRDTPLASIQLRPGETVFSSGDYARFFTVDDQRYQHIIDPRSGYPVTTRAATVIDRDPVLADVAATALVVGGPDDFSSVCDALGVATALLIDRLGNMVKTRAMQQRLQPVI